MRVVEVRDLSHEVNDVELFNALDLRLERGACIEVSGCNGAGKSTLIRILAGLIEPQRGELVYGEGTTGYVGEKPGFSFELSVRENLDWCRNLWKPQSATQTIQAVAECLKVGRLLDLPFGTLSAGQMRRASLCRLLIAPHSLWLLDEPMTNLDEEGRLAFGAALDEHIESGGTAVLATHGPILKGTSRELRLAQG